jgi:phosphatidylglycerol---prolipoprotein diacylglyceryl transferase
MFAAIPFPQIDPALLTIPGFSIGDTAFGPFPLRWYALAYLAGLLIGWRYMIALSKNDRLWNAGQIRPSPPACDDFLFYATLGVILGGRIGYVLFYNTHIIWDNPAEIFAIWQGGMSFHGGLIGVCLAVFWFSSRPYFDTFAYARLAKARAVAKKPDNGDYVEVEKIGWIKKADAAKFRVEATQKIPLLVLADLAAAVTPIGLFFGRLANFVNAELWGRPTDLPWGVIFPTADGQPRHPSQLYEAALEGLVLFSILRLATHVRQTLKKPGLTMGIFLLCYGLFRAALENVRQPDPQMPDFPFGMTMGMMLSLPMLIIGAYMIYTRVKPGKAASA